MNVLIKSARYVPALITRALALDPVAIAILAAMGITAWALCAKDEAKSK